MIFSYFDDSSDKRREKYFAAGGLIGGVEQWAQFDLRWAYSTRELEDPFRSTDCECGHGQFADWEKPKRDALMGELVGIIREFGLHAFASIIPISEYRKVFPDATEFDPYYLAVAHTIINMAVIGERIGHGMKLWFENNQNTSGSTFAIYNNLRNVKTWSAAQNLQNIDFGDKRLRPLQAADLVAREAFKHIDNLGMRPTRKPTERLKEHLAFILWTRETLEYLRTHNGPMNYDLLTSWGHAKWPRVPNMHTFYRNF